MVADAPELTIGPWTMDQPTGVPIVVVSTLEKGAPVFKFTKTPAGYTFERMP